MGVGLRRPQVEGDAVGADVFDGGTEHHGASGIWFLAFVVGIEDDDVAHVWLFVLGHIGNLFLAVQSKVDAIDNGLFLLQFDVGGTCLQAASKREQYYCESSECSHFH